MAAIDFPNAPALNQLYSAPNGVVYKWNGTLWLSGPTSGGVATPTYDSLGVLVTDNTFFPSANADAVMQITNGTQIFSRSFTAVDPTHPIEVDVSALLGGGGAQWGAVGLFIDGVAAAVRQTSFLVPSTNAIFPVRVYWQGVLAAGPHVFSVRFGGTGTTYVSGSGGVRVGGGAQATTMAIRELGVGPTGPQGAMGPTGAGGAWGTIATFILAAPQALIVSDGWQAGGWKDIHIMAQLLPTTNNVNPLMQFRKGGATLVDAGYGVAAVTCSETGASSYIGGAGTTSLLSVLVGGIGNLAGLSLDMRIPNIASLTPIRGVFQIGLDSQGGGGTGYHYQGGCRYSTLVSLPIDGISFGFSAGNIAAGSRMIIMGTK